RVDLNAFVSALEAETRVHVPAQVRTVFAPGDDTVHIIADPEQLREAVQRLITNAFEAMPLGGLLTVETQAVALYGEDAAAAQLHPGHYAMITVSDTGTGMTPDVLAHCFEPFFTTKPRRRNPGLGLATAYAMARQLGGGLAASSLPG